MKIKTLPLAQTGLFGALLRDYLGESPKLKAFYTHPPSLEGISAAMPEHSLGSDERRRLHDALLSQYAGQDYSQATRDNIRSLLHENTFTITTGHQLNIFTGPLFFIYKIVSVINACKAMKQAQPDKHFVPVYWMATEDHDLDEIRHLSLFGKTYSWDTVQKGPVGRMHTGGLAELAKEFPEAAPLFEEAYAKASNLAQATRRIVQGLFGDEGIVVLDGDDPELKRAFIPIMQKELMERQSAEHVATNTAALEEQGYKGQVFAREINLFYLQTGLRERIVWEDGIFKVLNTSLQFSEAEILAELEQNPERFSPNVILRPLYQQSIMPNVAYFGGPAEVAYWLQIKAVFDAHDVAFPVVMPRNFALWIGKGYYKKMQQLEVQPEQLFAGYEGMKEAFLAKEGFEAPDISEQEKQVAAAFEQLVKIAVEFDKSLKGFIEAEEGRALKSMEAISKRLVKAAESRMDISLRQLQNLHERLFPGGPQERVDTYLSIALNRPDFLEILLANLDPFNTEYYLFMEDEQA